MSIFGDLIDLTTLCDRGRAEIINKEIRYERTRHNTTVECIVALEASHRGDRESAAFMMRLLRAHEDSVVRVDQILTHYDGGDNIQREVRFFTDQSTFEWINADDERRGRRDRLGRSTTRTFREFQREVLGEHVPPPQLSPEGQRTLERLRQEFSRIPPSPGSRQIPDSRQPAADFSRATISVDPAAPTDQAAIVVAEYGQTLAVLRVEADASLSPNEIKIKASKDYGNKIIACRIGDPNSHKWIDVPTEGPTARRCSECKRVTGEFWKPDDYKRFIEWLVKTTKECVLLWARDIDATELRFSLLETDSNRKTTEESTTDDDAVIRFGLLDLK